MEVLKVTTSRKRPSGTDNPNEFFNGDHHRSFPSGEVTAASSIVTPFVAEYREDHPSVYALEILPVYDMVARVKVRGHWQTDVLAGYALGTGWGVYAHGRSQPLILSALPPRIYGGSAQEVLALDYNSSQKRRGGLAFFL